MSRAISASEVLLVKDMKIMCWQLDISIYFTFPKGNIEELRKCLQVLCDDNHTVQKMKRSAQGYICDKYNWNEVVQRTLELYQ